MSRAVTDTVGEEWGAAVEALARYLFAHPELRAFLESQRRSGEPMGWVNLACQHLPITASARQRLVLPPLKSGEVVLAPPRDALGYYGTVLYPLRLGSRFGGSTGRDERRLGSFARVVLE